MKRIFYSKVTFAIAAAAIVAVGMLRDPDEANADEIYPENVPHERMPGYQVLPNTVKSEPLTPAELAKLNAPVDGPVDTF